MIRSRLERIVLAGPGGLPWTAVVAIVLLILTSLGGSNPNGDTGNLILGSHQVYDCLPNTSRWGACSGAPYAPLQFIPSIFLIAIGFSDGAITSGLAALNAVAFGLALWMGWRLMIRQGLDLAAAALLLLLSGPLLVYAAQTFSEMLAAGAFVAVVYSLARRAPVIAIGAAAWMAGISKDTAIPFVLLLAAVIIFRATGRPRWADVRGPVLAVITGSGLAAITLATFNAIRWGAITNTQYAWDGYRTPIGRVPDSAAGLLVSPNGGMFVFWPLAALLAVAPVVFLVQALRQPKGQRVANAWPAVAILAAGIGLLFSLALWWAPFGWSAWGPRLALPTMTAIALTTLWRYSTECRAAIGWARRRVWPLALVGAVTIFSALANLGGLVRPLIAVFQTPVDICPLIPFAENIPGYYRCLHYAMWSYGPLIFQGWDQLDETPGITVLAVVVGLGLAVLIWVVSRGPRAPSDSLSS